ncbi:MAG: NADH-quinone oxidoreductase subunit NuoN [Magnetococcales bacterium]|nr:NADH-quinone oxidoreductase subunit NuoN [Magnetococcales bacterium]
MASPLPDIKLVLLLPEIGLSLLAMTLLLMSAWLGKESRGRIATWAIAGIALVAFAMVSLSSGVPPSTTLGGHFIDDQLARFMKLLLLVATAFPLLMAGDFLRQHALESGEYFVLSLFSLLGAMTMVSAGSFLVLYLGLELMSLPIYVLAAYQRDQLRSSEAGLKYFVLGSLASGILLYGISLVYGATGTTVIHDVATILKAADHVSPVAVMGAAFVVIGISFKVAAAPFHMWAPDVYEGAPTPVTAFIAIMPKIAAFSAFFRVLFEGFATLQGHWGPMLQVMAVISLAVGSLGAIAQSNIKRLLAYSSIGHVGFLLIGLITDNALGRQGVLFYLAIYIFMSLGAFCLVLVLNKGGVGDEIQNYAGLAKERPLLAFLMAVFMFSMAGIPPLGGFIAKLYVLMAAVHAGMITLAVIAVLFSAIGAFYYLRIVKIIYFDPTCEPFAVKVGLSHQLVLLISALVVLGTGLFPGRLLAWTQATVQSFL